MMRIDFHLHQFLSDPHFCKDRLKLMDAAEVQYSLLQPLPHLTFMGHRCGNNADVLRVLQSHRDRFLGSIYVDPRDKDALEELDRFAGEDFRCVKMWPPIGFYPDDPEFLPVFERIAELKLPILFHAGLTGLGAGTHSIFADPMRIEGLLRRFPETPFILAHWGGLGTFQSAWALMKANPNIFLDASTPSWSWPGSDLYRLYSSVTPIDFSRVVWGTDNIDPPSEGILSLRSILDSIEKPSYLDSCLGQTAKRLLRLD